MKTASGYFKWFYFSLRGRIGRQAYWMFMVIPFVFLGFVLGVVQIALSVSMLTMLRLLIVVVPLLAWIGTAVSVKRWHDVGRSAWWVLLGFIPYIGFVVTIVLGILRGEEGANRYGNSPHGSSASPSS